MAKRPKKNSERRKKKGECSCLGSKKKEKTPPCRGRSQRRPSPKTAYGDSEKKKEDFSGKGRPVNMNQKERM